jgi:hypothetical protein
MSSPKLFRQLEKGIKTGIAKRLGFEHSDWR